jgi:hypothetical protein
MADSAGAVMKERIVLPIPFDGAAPRPMIPVR